MGTGEIERDTALDELRNELVRRRLADRPGRPRVTMGRADRSAPLPLSFGQQQMWFLDQLDPGSAEYLVPLAFRIRGPLDPGALRRAWSQVVARHEILRTRYALRGAEPVQLIDEPCDVDVPVSDISPDRLDEVVAAEAVTPFDLGRDRPARARLLRVAPDDHVLVLVFHHIAFDAWSTQVVMSELSTRYADAVAGRSTELEPLPVQYADYAAWQRQEAQGERLAGHLDYWRRRLADLPVVDLPADRPRPPVRGIRGAAQPFTLPGGVAAQVRALAARCETTPFVVLLAAFQVLIARYIDRADVPVGTVVSGRHRPESQQLIGYCVNNLVLRAGWAGDPGFSSLVRAAARDLIDAYDHQAVPFARLVDELQPERDMSRSPLYQVAFTMHQRAASTFDLAGLTALPYPATGEVAKVDLELQIDDAPDGSLDGQLVYATSLFDADTMARTAGHFARLLESALADPEAPVSGLDLLDEKERAVLTAAPARVEPVTTRLPGLFEARAARTPDAIAVVAGAEVVSYREVNERANRLAHHLIARGAGPESLVGICLEPGPELIPTILGVLKSGAGYLPLDPANPPDRLGYVLTDAGALLTVTNARHAPMLAEVSGTQLVRVDDAALAAAPVTDPVTPDDPETVVYVIYTSGSTGRPKGCVLTHANVVRLLRTADEHYSFGGSDVWTLCHSFAFDVSVFEMWGALLYGGTLVIVPRDVRRSPDDLMELLVERRVTVLSQTPSAFRSLTAALAADDGRPDRLSLRAVIFAGERLEPADLRPWADRLGTRRPVFANMYGITETTVHTTFHTLSDEDLRGPGNPIGRPLSDLTVHLLDRHGQLVPIGVPGEIHVGGPGVARGYLNRPELTAERFVPDPFGPPGARLYRSGDLARRSADGSLDFLGRSDDQVKIRGHRVELGEIETALTAQPGVRTAIVVVRADPAGTATLVAYLVPAGGDQPDPADLRAALARDLPEYMVPAAFVTLGSIPLTANGKLDRRALPAPETGSFAVGGYQPPTTPLQEQVATAWGTALGVPRIGVHDGFFELGGDSLRAVALVGELRAAGFDIAVRDVFDRRTVAELAELLAGRTAPGASGPVPVQPFALISATDRVRVPAGVVDAYPLSQIQTGMVIEMLAESGENNYHNCSSFRILDDRPFAAPAFEQAVRLVVARHEVLRTSLRLTDFTVPMQLVHATARARAGTYDLTGLDDAGAEEALREFVRVERATPFDLTEPSLMRFHAHVAGGSTWWLSITECHPVMEGWSYHSLFMELLRAYRSIRDGAEPEPYERPAVRFADSIAAELAALRSTEDREHWQDIVARYTPFELPTGWGEATAPRTTHHVQTGWGDLEPALRALARAAGASLKSVLLAAYLKVLSQLTDAARFHAGLVYDVRPELAGADRVYGMYLNTLPIPFDRPGGTWLELVRQVFARDVESWPHRRVPLPAIQRALPEPGRLIQVFFNYQDFRQIDTDLVDSTTGIDDSPTEFPLTVSSRAGRIFLTADSRSLRRGEAERIAEMFRSVLEAMAADPHGDARRTFLPAGERERLLREWSVNPAEPVTHCVHELFAHQVMRTPRAVAVYDGRVPVTYAELDARANRYAHHIRALGGYPESVVGVLLDRGADLLAALLGAWKAGAAYLPIDPAFPPDRIRHMLADAAAPVLVTQSSLAGGIGFDGATMLVDADRAVLATRPDTAPAGGADLDRLAYVIYTSGSTGRSKGVQISHRGLVNHVRWAADELAGRSAGGAPLFGSVAFDLVVPNLWAPLLVGQAVHMVPQDLDLSLLGPYLAEAAPYSFIKLTPAHLEVLTYQLGAEQAGGLASVLVVAGEALTRRVVREWTALAPAVALINEYGPTEASVGTCVQPIDGTPTTDVVPIGRPLPNMTMYVLDQHLEPVPVGAPGELYVGGTGVARGYAGRPELTAEKFLPDPYGAPGARLYRSGDRARVRPDGSVEFLGRGDGQVKIRGYRVETGEIEVAIADHAPVAEVRVVVREEPVGGKRIVAYLVAAAGHSVDEDRLRARLERELPPYMMPSAFMVLDAIPLNRNGKLDHRALPAPGAGEQGVARAVAPRTAVERRIATSWSGVLRHEVTDVHADFFTLGGDSILGVALIGVLRRAGLDLTVADVFTHRTVAALAEVAAGRNELVGEPDPVAPFALLPDEDRALLPDGVVDAYPLSLVQTGMLVEMLSNEDRHFYHNVNVYHVHDEHPFEPAAFTRAVRALVARHDVLRTSVHLAGFSEPLQLVHAEAEVPVGWRDVTDLDDQAQRAVLTEFVARERDDVFDLSGPLLRVFVHVRGGSGWTCSLTQSHAIMDGWSNQLMLMDLVECYHRVLAGQDPLPDGAPPVRYADVIAAELAALESEQSAAYWQDIVDRHAKMSVPAGWHANLDAPAEPVRSGTTFGDLEDGLRALSAAAQASMKNVLIAAHLKVMSQLTDEPAFHTGVVSHTRPEVTGGDRMYGNFLNTLPFPADRSARTWRELVSQVARREAASWPHRHYPMPAIRPAGGGRLVDVFFSYLDFHRLDEEVAEDGWGYNDAPNEFSLRLTSLSGILSLSTNTHVLSQHNADRIAEMFRAVLAAMAANPDGDARDAYLPRSEHLRLPEGGLEPPGRRADRPPAATAAAAPAGAAYAAPRSPQQERIAAVWESTLGVGGCGLHDSFFALGGDSIKAVRLVGALRAGGLDVTVRDVMTGGTIAGLCDRLAEQRGSAADRLVGRFELVPAEDRERLPDGLADAYPLSQVQLGMTVEMLTGTVAYRSFVSYHVGAERPFDASALRRAAEIVIARHELLRTSFDLHTWSVPMQLVHAVAEPVLRIHDAPDRDALARTLAAERDAPFDLERAPLLHLGVHREPDGGWWLSISRPHAVTEGWSHQWLVAELMACYERLRAGEEPPAYEPPGVRYADHIAAERASLRSAEDVAYWQRVVDGYPPVTIPRQWGDPTGGEAYDVRVPLGELEQPLRALAVRLRVSVKSVLLAAHAKVMGQLTGAERFHLGLVCDARPEIEGADRVYGMHLNTVPFPVDRTARTWRELITGVFDRETELWPHRRYPLPAMQRLTEGRLLHIVFNYVDLPPSAVETAGTGGQVRASHTEFDATLHCRAGRLSLSTNTRVLSRASGERLAGMYRAVLAAIAADVDGDARRTYLPDGDQDRQPHTESRSESNHLDVPAELRRRAARTPDAVAVADAHGELSYGELNRRANRLAHRLRELGVGPETVVAICLDRSPELIQAVLAVLKAGGAYLPLDPHTPAERLAFMVGDAGARLLLTSRALAFGTLPTVLLDESGSFADQPAGDPEPVTDPDGLAYVIYTSGSTGRPKGAMVHRAGMGNHLRAKIEELGLTARDSVVQNASPAFDISVWQMLAPLAVGGRVEVVDNDTALDPRDLFGLVARRRITVLEVVPSLLRAALNAWDADSPAPGLPGLRYLMVTGEALPPDLCARWFDRFPHVPMVNAYGPTECSDDVTHAVLTGAVEGPRVPIGGAIRNTTLSVLDTWGEPLPAGVPGELHVGGVAVGRGYLGRPELTAERFVPDPQGAPGARRYRTGDLVTRLPNGEFDFLGRLDHQVKVRGHRIELGEIEAALTAHPGVRQAVVAVRVERIVAYLTAVAAAPTPEELRELLAATLPDYMIPTAYVALDEIPLTPNGKVDLSSLPEPAGTAFTVGEFVAPRTAFEARLARIWCTALELDRVGVRDGFFDLGGDSIRAIALVGAMRVDGIDVAVRDVFEARTIERLAALVAGRAPATATAAVAPFALLDADDRAKLPDGLTDAYPLGRVQLGMIIELLADPDRNPYHIINTFRVTDRRPLHPGALRRAAAVLAERHDVLRTSIRLSGFSQPLQLVHETVRIPVEVRDVRGSTEEELGRIRQELGEEQRAATFDLERAPLMRIIAHIESDDAWWVTFTQTHVITEGWSYHLLLEQLLDCYERIRDGLEPEPYEAPGIRFADVIAAELDSLASTGDREYWRGITSAHEPVVVPPELAGDSDERIYIPVPFDDLAGELRALASAVGVSLKSVLLAAHLKVMGQLTGLPAYHTGLVCDTRPEELGADRVLGMFVNTLPIAVDRSARTWRELLTQVFDREVELWAHRRYPMPAIQHEWGGGRLMSILFNYLDFHQVDTERVAAGTRTNIGPNEFALSVFNRGERLWVNSNERVLSRTNTERIAGMFRAVLESMAAGPDGDARAVYLPAGERERLLEQAVRAQPYEEAAGCVHELFEEQAARTPEAIAILDGDTELTYARVNARANRIAHRLRALGASPESIVAICLAPGRDLLPAVLGVLKSGAAYLPLDPTNPPERLGLILADAGVSVVVGETGTVAGLADVYAGDMLLLDGAALDTVPDTNPGPVAEPANLAYVIYTSGSTGRPKGVSVSHANVTRLLRVSQEHYAFDEADVWALAHTYTFDVSVFEMWGALLHGGALVMVPRMVARIPEDFLELLIRHEVTVLCQTPSAFRSLLGVLTDDDPRVRRLALRAIVFAGEKLETGELRPWVRQVGLGRVALTNMYGPTETTVYTTYHRYSKRDFAPGMGNPIGRPLADLSMHLLDAYGNLTPLGVPGEIHVAGPGVARGYLNRPELTAERFVPDPFGPPGSRLYRTGDLARRRPDGVLDFLGRSDDQVKIRGYRVELGEIEVALLGHPGIRDTAVVARPGEAGDAGDASLVAYVVPAGATAPEPAELRGWLGRTLPEYMIPAAYPVLASIPLNASGKLDRAALPAPDRSAFSGTDYVEARNPIEERLAAVWRAVLGVDRIGMADSFFDVGGDSVRAVMIAGRLRAGGLGVTARDLLEYRSIEALAARLAGRSGAPADRLVAPFELISDADRAKLPAGEWDDAYPLTRTQVGMLVEMMAGDGPLRYHRVVSVPVPATERFAAPALERALAELVRRHEVLRTSADLETYSVPMQLVHPAATVPLRIEGAADTDRLREFIARESSTIVPAGAPPLMRVCVHIQPDGGWQLTLTLSHLIIDGWSFSKLRTELLDLYRAFRDGTDPAPYEPPASRFADVVAAELRSVESAADRSYWRELVTRHDKFVLPRGWGGDEPAYRLSIDLSEVTDGLHRLAEAAGAPIKSVLLAAHLKVLSELTGQRRFHSGLVTHVRPELPGSERVYGTHLNTLPFPAEITAPTWRDLVRQVFADELAGWPHRNFPMGAIQQESGEPGGLIDVRFSYQDFGTTGADSSGSLGFSRTEFALGVSTADSHLVLTVDGASISRANGERLAGLYRAVLAVMAEAVDGDARPAVLPEDQRRMLLDDWSGRTRTGDPVVTLSALARFEARAGETPDAVALCGSGMSLTYGDLERRANGYARHLRGLGTGPESVVAVLLERGPDLIAWLLGIWKAGAAYLPLEPSHPGERLGYMVADVHADVLVTVSARAPEVAGFGGTIVAADTESIPPGEPLGELPDLDTLAYVIYTSGSSGRPKGVQITHRGLANHLAWAVAELASRGTGGAPLFSSTAFDLVVPNLWAPLLAGQPVTVLDGDLDRLGEALVAGGPYSFIKLTPAHLDVLTGQLTAETAASLTSTLVVAGEALGARTVRAWRELAPGVPVLNEYGPTEASVGSCVHPVTEDPGTAVVPIGRPLPNVTMYVLTERLDPVPAGVTGELYIGGAGLARGYRNRPELTAERFVPDPYGPPGARLYRTGDLVRHLPDGVVDFLGRTDRQVKVRGYRIEPGEIEAVIEGEPSVAAARVVVREDEPGDRRLTAYVVPASPECDIAALRTVVRDRLPEYLVPAAWATIDALPLTANGKLDERALPRPHAEPTVARKAPGTPMERRLAEIWQRVLGVPDLDVGDSFFDIGGHSIVAIKVVAEARAAGLPLSLFMVYQQPTLAGLAALLSVTAEPERAAPTKWTVPTLLPAMAETHTPGASVVRLGEGEIVSVAAFGTRRAGADGPVTPETVFQVGSMSKLVTAFGVLRLVDRGMLSLDEDVNAYLSGWRVPGDAGPVTVRQLLGHRSGLRPNEGKGYPRDRATPAVLDILHGRAPAGNAPVTREGEPGAAFRKANVHYSVLQQVMADATGTPFAELMRSLVLTAVGMDGSDFDQSFPERTDLPVAAGHHADGTPVAGGWLVRPDQAAAGLWTTATDVARLLLEIRRGWLGRPLALLSPELSREMLTPAPDSSYGLGTVVDASGTDPEFGHGGSPVGYHALATCGLRSGTGWVVLTNGFAGQDVVRAVLEPGSEAGTIR